MNTRVASGISCAALVAFCALAGAQAAQQRVNLAQLEGIAAAWKSYWGKVTGGVSTMETSVRK